MLSAVIIIYFSLIIVSYNNFYIAYITVQLITGTLDYLLLQMEDWEEQNVHDYKWLVKSQTSFHTTSVGYIRTFM